MAVTPEGHNVRAAVAAVAVAAETQVTQVTPVTPEAQVTRQPLTASP